MRRTIIHVLSLCTCLVLSCAGYDIRLTNGYGSLAPSNPHITILVTLDPGRFDRTCFLFDNGSFPTSTTATATWIDTSLRASRLQDVLLLHAWSSTFRVARWSVPSSATFGSSSSTAQLCPIPAHHGSASPQFGSSSHTASPHLGLPSAQPLSLNSAQARLGSPRHSSPYARPLRLTSAQPRLGSPRLDFTQQLAFARIATKVNSLHRTRYLSPATRLLFSCTDHDFGPS